MDHVEKTAAVAALKARIDVAAKRRDADLVIRNCRIVNVFTDEVIAGDIAVVDGFVAAIGGHGSYRGTREVDAEGRFAAPGLIDAHMHLESVMVRPSQFAVTAVAHGTLGVIADPHEIANVCGVAGIEFILEDTADIPLDVWVMVPSCVPATGFETSGASLGADEIRPLIDHPRVRGLGEMMNYPGVIAADEAILEKLITPRAEIGQVADGHSPWVHGTDLAAYAAAGIRTDHECATVDEMLGRARLGMYVQIREGSACRNLDALVPGVTLANSHRMLFCTDDKHPDDIARNGHIDNNIRRAVKAGLDAVVAVRMASLNVAQCYGLRGVGAIAPGYRADVLLLDSLEDFSVRQVYRAGELVAEDGKALFAANSFRDERVYCGLALQPLGPGSLRIPLTGDEALCMGMRPHSVETDKLVEKVAVADGAFVNDPARDILKLAVIERHHASGAVGLGLVKGFGLRGGAIASTVAHDSHNLIVIGDNDADMLAAAAELERVGGGITIVSDGQPCDTLPLPIAGLMSDLSVEEVEQRVSAMLARAYALGVNPDVEPFMTLAFMALPVIPALKLTDQGLFDVEAFSFTDIDVLQGAAAAPSGR
ncbi:MAG: adenine deaminase [Coriobacteriales bacterium]|jgi:adenine deaminase|nr:adenine deaminase [Coriobacteriales bacterium]